MHKAKTKRVLSLHRLLKQKEEEAGDVAEMKRHVQKKHSRASSALRQVSSSSYFQVRKNKGGYP